MTGVSISSIRFTNFKALKNYSVSLQSMNILVGPNNSGKSTAISSLRILDVALKKARRLKAERVRLPNGSAGFGHRIPDQQISVSLENVASDYNGEDSNIEFRLTNKNKLMLYFPSDGGCILHWETNGAPATTPAKFMAAFPITIQVVPVLGPLEHHEAIVNDETVKSSLNTHRACRHFRNYWHYFENGWNEFSEMIKATWPGMEVGRPEVDSANKKLNMFVTENRITREIYWSGFGFQIWCQLLTHISRANNVSVVVIDEPEIYLHPDVQRQLLGILRGFSADVVIATHSVEIMGEADPAEILLVNKDKKSAQRLKDVEGMQLALESIGSAQNVTLTHLARTKKIAFVEGMNDYKTIRRFARNLGFADLASGNDLTAFESGGFSSWEKIKNFAWGVKNTIDAKIMMLAVYDRDYYCQEEISEIHEQLSTELSYAHIHERKEMENYLLQIDVLERVLDAQIRIKNKKDGSLISKSNSIAQYLMEITDDQKAEVQAQYIGKRQDYYKGTKLDAATIALDAISEFEKVWSSLASRMSIVPGKATLRMLRERLQRDYSVNLTDIQIIDNFKEDEIPADLIRLIQELEQFRVAKT